MSNTVINVENLGKLYRLGEIGTGTLSHDINRLWARLRGKEDPFSMVGTVNDRTKGAQKGEHVWALNDVTFDVTRGEVLGIIGKNGAGKSTLLKLLSRVTSPTKGEVKIKGRVASLLEVGTGFHPEMTGRENIYMNGTIMGMRRYEIKAKLDGIVEFAGVSKYLDTPVKRYSSGMTVRLGFAVAAFLEPEILIVDEVLAVGDAEFQKRAIGKMQEVSKGEGRTVLFVSHNMKTIEQICSSAILLENGHITAHEGVSKVINNYLVGEDGIKLPSLIKDKKMFQWLGIDNQEPLNPLNPDDNVNISFAIKLLTNELNQLNVDLALTNEREEMVVHSRTPWVSEPFNLKNTGKKAFNYKIISPKLAPGVYYLTVFFYSGRDVIFHMKNIYAFKVSSKNYFGTSMILDQAISATVPQFSLSVS